MEVVLLETPSKQVDLAVKKLHPGFSFTG